MIEGLGGPTALRAEFRRTAGESSGFSVPAGRIAERTVSVPVTSAAVMEAMLSLQEADPALERDCSARRHGRSMLAALAALQRALLADGGACSTLSHLRCLAEELPQTADPALAAVLAAIRLRAKVELARHIL
jgi:hypothetical protein